MTDIRCLIGLHQWEEYRTGYSGFVFVTRSWCPRCKADSIRFGSYRRVERNIWIDRTPQDDADERARVLAKLVEHRNKVAAEYQRHMRGES